MSICSTLVPELPAKGNLETSIQQDVVGCQEFTKWQPLHLTARLLWSDLLCTTHRSNIYPKMNSQRLRFARLGGGGWQKTRFILIWVHINGGFLDRRSTN